MNLSNASVLGTGRVLQEDKLFGEVGRVIEMYQISIPEERKDHFLFRKMN